MCSQLLLIVAGDSHMLKHREHLKTPPSSADGRPPCRNVFTTRCALPCRVEPACADAGVLGEEKQVWTYRVIGCVYLHSVACQCWAPARFKEEERQWCIVFPFLLARSLIQTQEVCLAVSETVFSSNQPATTIATIISSSPNFPFHFFVSSWTFLSRWLKSKWCSKYFLLGWNWGIIFGHAVIWERRAEKNLKWQIDGHLLAYFSYLFLRWPRSAWWGW